MLMQLAGAAPKRPACPYCRTSLSVWPEASLLEPCPQCQRPLLLVRSPFDWRGPRRLRGLLDVGFAGYGLATVGLFLGFVVTGMAPHSFMRLFAILLFVIGSLLLADGVLALRTQIARTGRQLHRGRTAMLAGTAKIAAGLLALLLMLVGLAG